MPFQQTPYTWISFTAGFFLLLLTVYLIDTCRSEDATVIVLMLASVTGLNAVWSVAIGMGLISIATDAKVLWATVGFVGTLVPPTWVVFALFYTNRERWVTKWTLIALYGPSVAVITLNVLFGPQTVVWASVDRVFNGSFYVLTTTNQPWYRGVTITLYLQIVLGMGVLYTWLYRAGDIYRGQAAALIVGSLAPTVVNLLLWSTVVPHRGVNVTPVGFLVTGIAFTYAVVRYRLGSIVPVARASVVENMRDGYIVVDADGRVVDVNPAARDLIVTESPVGEPIETVLPDCPPLTTAEIDGDTATLASFETDTADGVRYIDVRPSVLNGGNRATTNEGLVLFLQDVTERHEREQELERANEQLDKFATIVSHDLRNPLHVAAGRLSLALAECDSDHLKEIETALDRMETLIEDTLQIARMGQSVDDFERVTLDDLVAESWDSVATADAELRTESLPVIEADRGRVRRLFENLFRNAVEHGGNDVTVRVGATDDGFFIEDTGPGIPVADQARILELGYTTSETGTGFGLAIVTQIASAHEWAVRVTDGSDGGARFEVTGVSPEQPIEQ